MAMKRWPPTKRGSKFGHGLNHQSTAAKNSHRDPRVGRMSMARKWTLRGRVAAAILWPEVAIPFWNRLEWSGGFLENLFFHQGAAMYQCRYNMEHITVENRCFVQNNHPDDDKVTSSWEEFFFEKNLNSLRQNHHVKFHPTYFKLI